MLPASIKEFDELVTQHIDLCAKRSGKRLSRTDGAASFRLHYPSVAAIEPQLRESTELQESDAVDAWVRMGLGPEAAKIAARVESNEFKPKAVAEMTTEDWAKFRFPGR